MREDRILSRLQDQEYLTVEDAAGLVRVSQATVRRDFARLAGEGLVERTRGGVRRAGAGIGALIPPFAHREVHLAAEKRAIARAAAALLAPGDVVFVGGGTTTYHLAAALPEFPVRLVTNSVRLATAVSEKPERTTEVHVVGGILYPEAALLLGPEARSSFSRYNARWAFLSVGGVNRDGVTNTNELVVETQRAMIDHAEQLVVLVDHSKLGRVDMSRLCGLDDVDVLVTDRDGGSVLEEIRLHGVNVRIALPAP